MSMIKLQNIILSILTFVLLLWSCEKPTTYSEIPEIKFKSVSIEQTQDTLGNPVQRALLAFTFVDGDGDLGLNPSDTIGEFAPSEAFYYNLMVQIDEKENGVWIANPIFKGNYRFVNISNENTTNHLLKGEMIVEIDITSFIQFKDTTRFKYFIYDRGLHQSNIDYSNEIYLNE